MADLTFTNHSSGWWGYNHHYGEWFHGDLEHADSDTGSSAIKRKKKDGLHEWILVDPESLKQECSDRSTG